MVTIKELACEDCIFFGVQVCCGEEHCFWDGRDTPLCMLDDTTIEDLKKGVKDD